MRKNQRVSLCVLLIIFAVLVQGCTGTADSMDTTEPVVTTPVLQDLHIVADNASDYSIIICEGADKAVTEASRSIVNAIHDATGVKPGWTDDYIDVGESAPAKEILVGLTNREESLQLLGDVAYGEYAIRVMGEKIVIAAWEEASLIQACSDFAAFIGEHGTQGNLTIAHNYTGRGVGFAQLNPLPHYGAADEDVRFVDLGDECYMLYADNTDEAEFRAYFSVLETAGYTQFASRQLGDNLHAVYVREDKIIHASYMAKDKDARISIEDAYDMTLFTEQEYEKICEPSVTMVGQEVYMNDREGVPTQNGLCLIFRLEDGRFVIVDGGDYVPAAGPLIRKTLRKLAVDKNNITVAAWFLTHTHSDHTGGFVHFTDDLKLHKQIKIENVIHHFAAKEQYDLVNDPGQVHRIRDLFLSEYPGTNIIKAHTGQVFKIGGMEIEMLFTYEDLEPSPLEYMNTTSLVFRVKCQDNTVMVLGDASNRSCKYLVHSYGDFLKSDMVQIAHHGYTGGTIALYEAIDADVLLWPCGVASVNGSYENLMTRDHNAKAMELAKEIYIAGETLHTLPLPYAPQDVDEPIIVYGIKE